MADLEPVTLAVIHHPDFDVVSNDDKTVTRTELPGTYMLGFVYGGAFHPLQHLKGGGIQKRIANAQAAAPAAPADTPAAEPPAPDA